MRTKEQKYGLSIQTANMIQAVCPKIQSHLMNWIEAKVNSNEIIEITYWCGDLFYVCIKDSTVTQHHPAEMSIGFTVDIKADKIYWNNDFSVNPSGGNCFVRSKRWKRLVSRQFAPHDKTGMHQYNSIEPETP
ncbi:MAG: hypothetical protein WC375_00140 [Methanomassiliicoccales archaeon]|jgi:hypothetical protein